MGQSFGNRRMLERAIPNSVQRIIPVRVETVVTLFVNVVGFSLLGSTALLAFKILFP